MRSVTTATKTAIGLVGAAASLLAMDAFAFAQGHSTARTASCRPAQLKARHGFSNGAAGSLVTPLRLRNVSREACSLRGYPRITLLDGHGHAVRKVRHSGGARHTVRLAPGGTAEAFLRTGLTSPTGDSDDCPRARSVRIAPPHRKRSLRLRIKLVVCDADVSPLKARRAASARSGAG